MMRWLPTAEHFRQDLKSVLASRDSAEALGGLVRLSQHDLNYLQTIQLDQTLRRIDTSSIEGYRQSRIAVLSSSTADHLLPGIRVAQLRRNDLTRVYLCQYAQYHQELLDRDSGLHDFSPDFVLFSLSAKEVLSGISIAATRDEADRHISGCVDDLVALWTKAQRSLNATVIQQTFLNTGEPVFGSYDRLLPAAPTHLVRAVNEAVAAKAAENDVLILDMERAAESHGLDFWFDITKWLHAKIELSPPAVPMFGELLARIVSACNGLSRKCLVLDLDNTLWGGVVGDDGIDQIVLGEGSGLGEAFLAFQRYVRRLGERGILLAVCSKNDEATAESVFSQHPEMQLGHSDFSAFIANWDDKATNLQRIAEQLNIGIDSLVFVDDNPAERARIRQSLPMVAVPELPDDPAHFVSCLSGAGYFEAVSFTADDANRRKQYAENASRQALQSASESLDDFLKSLDMVVTSGPFRSIDLQRITQLVNKTNQFNTTTRRRSLEELRSIGAEPTNLTLQFRLADRFGDNGLVSAVILRPAKDEPRTMDIDSWVMSCRVFGRELEAEIMNCIVAAARSRTISHLTASYIPTKRNAVIKELYPRLGFAPGTTVDSDLCGQTRWTLDLGAYMKHETHIAVRSQ